MSTQHEFEIGDRVRVVALGEFYRHDGVIVRIVHRGHYRRKWYRVVFDNHPWQKPGVDWAFSVQELEVIDDA